MKRLAVLLLLSLCCMAAAAHSRPNIVMIIADDLGYGDLKCYGSEIPTPHIDSLARGGARFTDFYVAASTCTPSRFALLTGRAPIRSRDRLLNPLAFGDANDEHRGLRTEETTLATKLGEAGNRTALIGKWHLGHGEAAFLPTQHGFQSFFGFTGGAVDYFTFRYGNVPDLHRNKRVVDEPGFVTMRLTEEAVTFLHAQTPEQPFFLCLAHLAPHFGKAWDASTQTARNVLQPRPEELARVPDLADRDRREYAATVLALDDGVGVVLDALKKTGLADNTLIIFQSDNGGAIPHGGSNKPLRGMKTQLHEGGIRVPCLVRWPGKIAPGRIVREPVSALDWFPTLSKLAGVPIDPKAPLDGMDITSLLTESAPLPPRTLFWTETAAERDGGKSSSAVRRGLWKLLVTPDGKTLLYDLIDEPVEEHDLSSTQTAVKDELQAALTAWLQSVSNRHDR
jgi:arylsulfatase A-like enzyme